MTKLNLNKPLIIFDLETTGLDVVNDRIIQLSYIKVLPGGEEKRENILINPERKISKEITQLTGITNEMVEDKPVFKEVASHIEDVFRGSDVAGYNSNHFDVPMLAEEFARADIDFDFSKCRLIDVQTIFHKMERRNLAAAYKFYCGRKMEEDFTAHSADDDAEATYRVLQGQLDLYTADRQEEPERVLKNDMDFLASFSKQNDFADFAGRMVYKPVTDVQGKTLKDAKGETIRKAYFNFGKYKGMAVDEVLTQDPGYYSWMMGADFSANTKQVLTRIRLGEFNAKR